MNYLLFNKIDTIYILTPKNFYYYLPFIFRNIKFYAITIKAKKNRKSHILLFGDGTPKRQFMHAKDLAKIIHKAFEVATTGRPGPVLVDIPKDVQFQKTSYTKYKKSKN